MAWQTVGIRMDHFPLWFTIQLHSQMGCLSNRNTGMLVSASQDCCCWNFYRNKCGSICIFWRAADIISFFFLPLSNIPYKKTLAFQVWLWIIASFSNFLHLGALKRLWSSPECRALWGWEDVSLGLPQFCLLPFTNITTSVVLSEQMKEQNCSSPSTGWRGLLWSYLLT